MSNGTSSYLHQAHQNRLQSTPSTARSPPTNMARQDQHMVGNAAANNRSSQSAFHPHGNFVHGQNVITQNGREVIELSDSDPEPAPTQQRAPLHNSAPRSNLQPPFDPIPRSSASLASATSSPHRPASIASLINPDNAPSIPIKLSKSRNPSPTSHAVFFPGSAVPAVSVPSNNNAAPAAAAAPVPAPVATVPQAPAQPASKKASDKIKSIDKSPKSAASSTPHSPKPARPTERTIPKTGNGLLAGTLPGMGPAEAEPQLPTIYIHVPLNGETNKYVNFARLAEERYGWAALNPKLAKSKLGLHMDSGDEMMMDDSASDSNTDTNKTAQPDPNQPRKRQKRTYQDVYDKNDPFIDDSEMMWEEQAAASKDGFFVYSGPLVPEGSKPQIERADGTMRRGRGRGRGGRGGASNRGSGATARKPRVTKKQKEIMDREKAEREGMLILPGVAGKPQPVGPNAGPAR